MWRKILIEIWHGEYIKNLKETGQKEPVIPLMYLMIMADYQSQECLVIPILVIPKEIRLQT